METIIAAFTDKIQNTDSWRQVGNIWVDIYEMANELIIGFAGRTYQNKKLILRSFQLKFFFYCTILEQLEEILSDLRSCGIIALLNFLFTQLYTPYK